MFGKKQPAANPQQPKDNPFLVAWRTEDSGMVVNINPEKIESPNTAGIILVDLMRHMSRALAQTGKAVSEDHARAEMLAMFLAELQNPTDEGTGTLRRN